MTAMLLLLVLALLLFGPKQTYTLAIEAGRYVGMLKRAAHDLQRELDVKASPEPASDRFLADGDQQVYLSPSNVTVPGRKVEDISDPQLSMEVPVSASPIAPHNPVGDD